MLHALMLSLKYRQPCRCSPTLEMGETKRDSTLIRGLYTFCLAKPGSMTYTMPSMVSEVSAMLVETTILRPAMPFLPAAGACSTNHHMALLCEIVCTIVWMYVKCTHTLTGRSNHDTYMWQRYMRYMCSPPHCRYRYVHTTCNDMQRVCRVQVSISAESSGTHSLKDLLLLLWWQG